MKPARFVVRMAAGLPVLLGFALGAFWMQAATAASAPARIEPVAPCFVAPPEGAPKGLAYDCGYVLVPENASKPTSRQIKLGFLRLKSRAAKPKAPVFMLAGGPGSSLIKQETFLFFDPAFLGALLDTRDVIVLDQRGTAHAKPQLDCPGLGAGATARFTQGSSEEAEAELQLRVLEDCIRDMRHRGIDLAQYNSVAIAGDIDAARAALGYERIVYYGASYGAQLGQHVMRDYPAMLEAVILDGANSLSRRSWIEDRALDVDYSIRHIDELCRSQPKCRAAYDIPALIERGLALFDAGPIPVTYTDPQQPGKTLKFDVRRSDFVALIYQQQGNKIGVMSLPALLDALLKDGRTSVGKEFSNILGAQYLAQSGHAAGGEMPALMHFAVVCSDDPVRSPNELVVEGVGSRYARLFGEAVAQDYVRACQTVSVPSLPDSTDVNVASNIPTLILSGGLDAQTPTFRSELVAKSLPNARLVVFPDGTHVQLGAINLCAAQIMTAFVNDPKGEVPLQCVDKSRFPGFMLPDGTVSQ